jgi:hypothetical protein
MVHNFTANSRSKVAPGILIHITVTVEISAGIYFLCFSVGSKLVSNLIILQYNKQDCLQINLTRN